MGIKKQEETYKLYLKDGVWKNPKILRNKNEIQCILDNSTTKPVHVTIDPIEICNQRCSFCYYHGNRKDKISNFSGKGKFSFNRLINLIDELKESGTRAISFTGTGETLLYPRIYEIFQKIIDNEIEFGITTNLNVNISDEEIDILSNASWIRCSLNATDKEIYDKIHRPIDGGLNRVLDNIGLLPNINLSYVIVDENIQDIVKTTRIANDIGVNSIFFRLEMTFDSRKKSNKYLNKVEQELKKAKKIESESFKVYSIHENIKINQDLLCYYSNHTAYIDSYGNVYPCCVTKCNKKYAYGNILNQKFNIFWDSDKRKDNYKKLNMNTCPPCIHYIDNSILELLYNNDKISNNFI